MIKQLSGAIREYKKASILAPLFVVLEVLMEVLIPLVTASLIDNGIEVGNLPYVVKIGLVLILMALASLFFGIMSGRNAAVASAGFAKNLRKDMYYTVQNYSFTNIDKFSTSSIVTRLTTDVTNVQNAYIDPRWENNPESSSRIPPRCISSIGKRRDTVNRRTGLLLCVISSQKKGGLWGILRPDKQKGADQHGGY